MPWQILDVRNPWDRTPTLGRPISRANLSELYGFCTVIDWLFFAHHIHLLSFLPVHLRHACSSHIPAHHSAEAATFLNSTICFLSLCFRPLWCEPGHSCAHWANLGCSVYPVLSASHTRSTALPQSRQKTHRILCIIQSPLQQLLLPPWRIYHLCEVHPLKYSMPIFPFLTLLVLCLEELHLPLDAGCFYSSAPLRIIQLISISYHLCTGPEATTGCKKAQTWAQHLAPWENLFQPGSDLALSSKLSNPPSQQGTAAPKHATDPKYHNHFTLTLKSGVFHCKAASQPF